MFLIKKTIKKITFGHANDLVALEVFCPISLKDDWKNAVSLRKLNSFGFINIQTKRQDGSLFEFINEFIDENEFEYDFTLSNQISSISKFDQKNSNLN